MRVSMALRLSDTPNPRLLALQSFRADLQAAADSLAAKHGLKLDDLAVESELVASERGGNWLVRVWQKRERKPARRVDVPDAPADADTSDAAPRRRSR